MAGKLAGRVVIYSIVGCPHCKSAKFTLKLKGIPFTDVSIDQYASSVKEQVQKASGSKTVPLIYFNEVLVGGNVALQQAVKDADKWNELIQRITDNAPPENWPIVPGDDLKLSDSHADHTADFVCEQDENGRLIEAIRESDIIQDHRKGLFKQKNTFTGNDLVTFLIGTGLQVKEAIGKGRFLLDHHYIHRVKHEEKFTNDENLYRLLEHDDTTALNHGDTSNCRAASVNELGEDLRKLILKLYNNYLSEDGRKVDYAGIGGSDDFKTYQAMTTLLHRVQIEQASREEKLAFFINIYNALVIHANVVSGPPTNLWQRYKFFNSVKYVIGGHPYSLQDMENGVLRANRKGVGMIFRPFSAGDPRLCIALKQNEPLIHFALVCGAKSCPPIKTYSADDVMNQLKMAGESFMEGDDVIVDTEKRTVSLSRIFSWYKEDFGGTDTALLNWICENMAESKKKLELHKLITDGKVKVSFLPYDWSVNK